MKSSSSSEEPDISSSSKNFACSICKMTFASNSSLWNHNKRLHPEVLVEKCRQPNLKCGICLNVFISQREICKHVADDHSLPVIIEEVHFESIADFDAWMQLEEKKSNCRYISDTHGRVGNLAKNGIRTNYYHCHRSGNFESKGDKIRAPRENVTNRCGFQCSAFVTSRINPDGTIDATYCVDRYGHDSSISRLPLSVPLREKVKADLLDGRSFDWILKKARENFDNPDGPISRDQLLKRCDIFNIENQFGLRKYKKHQRDMESVWIWMEEHKDLADNPFFCYHPLQEKDGTFILGIQNKFQMDMLRRFAPSVICMDATHGTTHYKGYLLVTVLVVTDQGKGFPVALFIVDRETEENLQICLKALRERVGPLSPKFFMSDDAGQYWNAWTSAFGDCSQTTKLLCSWHVKRAWETNMKSKAPAERHQSIRSSLDELMNAEHDGKFRVLLTSFRNELRQNQECVEFLDYFDRYYCGHPLRIQEWALWARRDSVVNTNMHLESFHDKLKHRFLAGKQGRRMDALICELLEVIEWYLQDFMVMKECGVPANTYRMQLMNQRHKDSLKLSKEKIKRLEDDSWLVASETTAGRFYRVARRAAGIICDCMLKCRFCKVCPDMYVCTCYDGVMPTSACKHVHLIHEMVYGDVYSTLAQTLVSGSSTVSNDDNGIVELEQDNRMESPDPVAYLQKSFTAMTTEERMRLEALAITASISGSLNSELHDRQTLVEVLGKLKQIAAMLKMPSTQTASPVLSEEVGPANKKAKRQRRY